MSCLVIALQRASELIHFLLTAIESVHVNKFLLPVIESKIQWSYQNAFKLRANDCRVLHATCLTSLFLSRLHFVNLVFQISPQKLSTARHTSLLNI